MELYCTHLNDKAYPPDSIARSTLWDPKNAKCILSAFNVCRNESSSVFIIVFLSFFLKFLSNLRGKYELKISCSSYAALIQLGRRNIQIRLKDVQYVVSIAMRSSNSEIIKR